MFILHCLEKSKWEKVKDNINYGYDYIKSIGFIHCSSIQNFWRVAPNFQDNKEPLLLLIIDSYKVEAEIKWEDHDHCGREYPHIYGELNLNAVIDVVPFLKDENGNFILNEEIKQYV